MNILCVDYSFFSENENLALVFSTSVEVAFFTKRIFLLNRHTSSTKFQMLSKTILLNTCSIHSNWREVSAFVSFQRENCLPDEAFRASSYSTSTSYCLLRTYFCKTQLALTLRWTGFQSLYIKSSQKFCVQIKIMKDCWLYCLFGFFFLSFRKVIIGLEHNGHYYFPRISVLTSVSWWKPALLHFHQISFKYRKFSPFISIIHVSVFL